MAAAFLADGRVGVELGDDCPVGACMTALGPLHPNAMRDPVLLGAVEHAVRQVAHTMGEGVGRALARDPRLCSRCARTLARAALGDGKAARAITHPTKQGDVERYRRALAAMQPALERTRKCMQKLSDDLHVGMTGPLIEQAMESAGANPWDSYYELTGAPMKSGQWTEYKSCACGEPGTGGKPEKLPVESMVGSLPR